MLWAQYREFPGVHMAALLQRRNPHFASLSKLLLYGAILRPKTLQEYVCSGGKQLPHFAAPEDLPTLYSHGSAPFPSQTVSYPLGKKLPIRHSIFIPVAEVPNPGYSEPRPSGTAITLVFKPSGHTAPPWKSWSCPVGTTCTIWWKSSPGAPSAHRTAQCPYPEWWGCAQVATQTPEH